MTELTNHFEIHPSNFFESILIRNYYIVLFLSSFKIQNRATKDQYNALELSFKGKGVCFGYISAKFFLFRSDSQSEHRFFFKNKNGKT